MLGLRENIDIASHMTNLSQTFIQGHINGTVDGVSTVSATNITEDQHHDLDEMQMDICEDPLSIIHNYSRWNLW